MDQSGESRTDGRTDGRTWFVKRSFLGAAGFLLCVHSCGWLVGGMACRICCSYAGLMSIEHGDVQEVRGLAAPLAEQTPGTSRVVTLWVRSNTESHTQVRLTLSVPSVCRSFDVCFVV